MTDTRESDRVAALPLDGHTHGADPREHEIVVDLMHRLGVGCGHLGAHSHGNQPRHHHHDFRCLVEAGANQVRPKIAELNAEVVEAQARTQAARRHISRLRTEREEAFRRIGQMVTFMQRMAAVGPWTTVLDAWKDYQAEMAGLGPGDQVFPYFAVQVSEQDLTSNPASIIGTIVESTRDQMRGMP